MICLRTTIAGKFNFLIHMLPFPVQSLPDAHNTEDPFP
jgi:hypothetical protein